LDDNMLLGVCHEDGPDGMTGYFLAAAQLSGDARMAMPKGRWIDERLDPLTTLAVNTASRVNVSHDGVALVVGAQGIGDLWWRVELADAASSACCAA
jgi:hypothetical protein